MKKIIVLFILICLCACSNKNTFKDDTDHDVGDESISNVVKEYSNKQYAFDEDKMIIVINEPERLIRYTAKINNDIYNKLLAVDLEQNKEEQYEKILKNVFIEKIEDFSDKIPTEEKLKTYIGMNGGQFVRDNDYFFGYNLDGENPEFYIAKGLFSYRVIFEGKVEKTEEFNELDAVQNLTIKEIYYLEPSGNIFNLNVIN